MSKKIVSEVRSVYGKKKREKSVIKGKFPELFKCIVRLSTLKVPTLRCTCRISYENTCMFKDQSRILSLVIFFFHSHGIYV